MVPEYILTHAQAVTKAKLGYNPVEVDPEDIMHASFDPLYANT
jgi:hypothetical protein